MGEITMESVIKKSIQDIKDYVKSIDKADNINYQENSLLIDTCFSKAIEIIETNVKAQSSQQVNILQEAEKAVYGDRQDDYGSVKDNFATIAALWSVILKTKVSAEQVGLCMVQVKVARQMFKPKRDNLVDGAGYFAIIEKMQNEK